ncbi:uncharacterized protein [Onthophagus taurus]|uniref:uncharacterized protein n=1 Tax=Onthophagus taurus TaxID=166361 RepID=UPI0039BE6927
MESLKQPKSMSMTGDLGQNWKKFRKAMDVYINASGCSTKDKKVQASVWIHCMGEEAAGILETLDLNETDEQDPEVIKTKLDEYFIPKTNISVERHKFNTRIQMEGETFDGFLSELRKIAANCDFGTLKEELIKDRIVCATRDKRVKDRLLRESNLTLKRATEICQAAEQTSASINELVLKQKVGDIAAMGKKYNQTTDNKQPWRRSARYQAMTSGPCKWSDRQEGKTEDMKKLRICNRCGKNWHQNFRECPALNKTCFKCSRKGHFSFVCKTKNVNSIIDSKQESNQVDNNSTSNNYVLDSINNNQNNVWFEIIRVLDCNKRIRIKIDTGSSKIHF